MYPVRYVMTFVIGVAFVISGCGGDKGVSSNSGVGNSQPSRESSVLENSGEVAAGPTGQVPGPGGNFLDAFNFPFDQVFGGGPSKDGIPALTDPTFVAPGSADASYLKDDDLVMGLVINGEAKAYPHNIGWWHEIINDVVGGHPVVVSFCPLTGTGMVFDGLDVDNTRITCGVSGLLFNNNLIMYDRRDDETLYPQMTAVGILGPQLGGALELMSVVETTWRYWKQLYPDTQVIGGQTKVYGTSKYTGYPYGAYRTNHFDLLLPPFPPLEENPTSQFFDTKQMTLGIRFGQIAKAYPFPVMGDEAVINDAISGLPLVVVWYAQEQLAIPYFRTFNGQTLTFEKVASDLPVYPFLLRDMETGTTWNLKGEAIAGAHQGARLNQVPAHNAFWFAWATFWRNTGIY